MKKLIEIAKQLNRKHLLLVGGSKIERKKAVSKIIANTNYETFRFPAEMEQVDDYIEYVRKNKLFTPWYDVKGKHGDNQVLDFHSDWISENHSLIIMEEIQMMEEKWRIELIRWYLEEVENHKKGEKFIHLVISQDEENGLIEKLSEAIQIEHFRNRTKKQIVEGSLKVIDITD